VQSARIIHDLKNYISVLLLGIEMFEAWPGHPAPYNLETLKNLGCKMSRQLENLTLAIGKETEQKKMRRAEAFAEAKDTVA
jgi:hypothetical protein